VGDNTGGALQATDLTPGQELKAVEEYAHRLQQEVFPDLKIGLVHGKLSAKAKAEAMTRFASGETDVLVATTVIEVGVDVPNATLMVVENAERFGLSQLHQLRGRVGRGSAKSYCVLVSSNRSQETRKRLKALCATNDGFRIAETDLELRGPGDFFGNRQHGLPQLRVADLAGDMRVLQEAQKAAEELLAADPHLQRPENRAMLEQVQRLFDRTADTLN
jgi:ATP-dependent DNA helicase RecG